MRGIFNIDGPVMSVLSKVCDLLWLNVLTIICCIPVVTAGASLTALYYMTLKMAKNEEGYITRGFFKSFKENFKQSTIIWMILLLVMIVFYMDYRIYTYAEMDFPKFVVIGFYMILMLFLFTVLYIFPLQARFVNSCKGTIKNAFLLSITQLPRTLLMLLVYVAPILVFLFFPVMLPVNLMFGLSVPAYASSLLLAKVFKTLEEKQLEDKNEDMIPEEKEI